MTTTDNRRPPLPRVALGVRLRKSRRENEEDFEIRNQELINGFIEYKRRNYPQANLAFTEAPLLFTDIVKYPQTSCNQQRRPKMIITNGSLGTLFTAATKTFHFNIPVPQGVTASYTDTAESILALTAATTSPVRSEQEENELMKELQKRNPVYRPLDFSQYIIQKPHKAEKIVAGILQDLLNNLNFAEDKTQECQDKSSKTGIKFTRFQEFRRSLKSLKTRFVRAMKPLTSCFRSTSTKASD